MGLRLWGRELKPGDLWQPREVGWDGSWEGGSRGRGNMHPYGWLILVYGRNQHNIVKRMIQSCDFTQMRWCRRAEGCEGHSFSNLCHGDHRQTSGQELQKWDSAQRQTVQPKGTQVSCYLWRLDEDDRVTLLLVFWGRDRTGRLCLLALRGCPSLMLWSSLCLELRMFVYHLIQWS